MYQVILSIFLLEFTFGTSNFMEGGYQKPKVERGNILNKGIWVKNVNDKSTANFLFRGNSVDVDNMLQGDFNPFEDNNGPSSAFISSYVERTKRAVDHNKALRRFRKSLNNCSKGDCSTNNIPEENSIIKSKLLTKLKPASVFNDYPYEIALLLGNNKNMLDKAKNYSSYVINELIKDDGNINKTMAQITELETNYTNGEVISFSHDDKEKDNYTSNVNNPKRSMTAQVDENGNVKIIEFNEFNNSNTLSDDVIQSEIVAGEIGRTPVRNPQDRDIFDKDNQVWRQNAPLPNIRFNKLRDEDPKVVRPVTERGLVKVLSMLTKTFKKIMKQHGDIKEIHRKLSHVNEDFLKTVDMMSKRFNEFDNKYTNLAQLADRLKNLESKLNAKEEHFKAKERELSKNLVDFEIQQKKFLQQQRQFYNIQKLMLAQNERINAKQNSIAKTQSEISHRQNNFARILKKAKQVYVDNQYPKTTFVKSHNPEYIEQNTTDSDHVTHTTTVTPKSSESIKINLFSIPSISKIKNQDQLLLNEKDEQPVDDLVYKYYFNNTFIDNLMKHFLSNFLNSPDSVDSFHVGKSKRDHKNDIQEITTLLLPINKTDNVDNIEFVGKTLNRERRWISHHSRRKWRKKNRGKAILEIQNTDDEKTNNKRNVIDNNFTDKGIKRVPKEADKKELSKLHKNDAFMTMAKNFCNGIGQNQNSQILDWCVEKALRKLQNIETKMPHTPAIVVAAPAKNSKPRRVFEAVITKATTKAEETWYTKGDVNGNFNGDNRGEIKDTKDIKVTTQKTETSPTTTQASTLSVSVTSTSEMPSTGAVGTTGFFPDNDKLESNLKEFDLTKDLEGNVYYDGSLHASDIVKEDKTSQDNMSDIMPGLESNSRIDAIDPETLDTKAMRRAMVRRMKYENIFKKIPL